VLLLHRRLPFPAVLAGIGAALAAGSICADVVAIEARKHAGTTSDAAIGAGICAGNGEPGQTSDAGQTGQLEPVSAAVSGPQRSRAALVTLGARRQAAAMAELPADQRPAPSVRDYDQLLAHRTS